MRDDPTSLEKREPTDDAEFRAELLHGPESDGISVRLLERTRRVVPSRPQFARKLSLGVLVTLLLAIAVTVWPLPLGALLSPAIFPTATAASSQLGTPMPPPGAGWIPSGPSAAQRIIFAPGAPAIAYTCGAPGLSSLSDPVPIVVDISRDDGRTWQTLKTPALGTQCDLTVNPANWSDVVLVTIPSQASPSASALEIYRSFDGGATWRPWALPADPGRGTAHIIWYQWAWASTTLFVAPYVAGDRGSTRLAASVDQQPLAWVQQHGVFAGAPADASINDLIGTPTTLYVDLFRSSSCAPYCTRTMQTRDGGASWSQFTGQFQGQPVYLLQGQLAAGATPSLFGVVIDPTDPSGVRRTYVHAEDGGVTWRPLVAPPSHLIITQLMPVPDGTLYAELYPFPEYATPPGIFVLVPGADAWRFVAPYPPSGGWITVRWDQQGHALALWGSLPSLGSGYPQVGLETHAL